MKSYKWNYREFIVALLLMWVTMPAHTFDRECVANSDCWFKSMNETLCRDDPTRCKSKDTTPLPNNVTADATNCPARHHVDYTYFLDAAALGENHCRIYPVYAKVCDTDKTYEWETCEQYKRETGAKDCKSRYPNAFCCTQQSSCPKREGRGYEHRVCNQYCTVDPEGHVLWACVCKPPETLTFP